MGDRNLPVTLIRKQIITLTNLTERISIKDQINSIKTEVQHIPQKIIKANRRVKTMNSGKLMEEVEVVHLLHTSQRTIISTSKSRVLAAIMDLVKLTSSMLMI